MNPQEFKKVEAETQAAIKDWSKSPRAEIEEMKKRVDELRAGGASDIVVVKFLMDEFGFREDIALNEVHQGFPIFKQLETPGEFNTDGTYHGTQAPKK